MNSVVSQTLRCLSTESGRKSDWEQLLATVEMTINSSPNSSTGYSPFYLNYGFHPIAPVELLAGDENSTVEAAQNSWKGFDYFGEKLRKICSKQ